MEKKMTQEIFSIVLESISAGLQNNADAQEEWAAFVKLIAAAEISEIDKDPSVQKQSQELTARFIKLAPKVALAV